MIKDIERWNGEVWNKSKFSLKWHKYKYIFTNKIDMIDMSHESMRSTEGTTF
jgi:hypothetical protein